MGLPVALDPVAPAVEAIAIGAVFVTGGSGVVGRPIVRALMDRGRDVVALARSDAARDLLESLGARPRLGDVTDEGSVAAGMHGCEVAYHVAGVNSLCVRDPRELYRVNVAGARRVVQAAGRAGIRRVVFTSSAAAIGEVHGTVGTEESAHRGFFLSHYERSKWMAERAAWAAAERTGVEVVCVNPSSVQGPGRAGGTTRLLIRFVEGRLPFFVDTTLSLVDIDDCARGHLLAEERGAPGQRYILNGASVPARAALEMVAELARVERRPRALPGAAAMAASALIEAVARVRGKPPPLCREMTRTLLHGHAYDGSRATRALGLDYAPLGETLRRTIEWLTSSGHARAP